MFKRFIDWFLFSIVCETLARAKVFTHIYYRECTVSLLVLYVIAIIVVIVSVANG